MIAYSSAGACNQICIRLEGGRILQGLCLNASGREIRNRSSQPRLGSRPPTPGSTRACPRTDHRGARTRPRARTGGCAGNPPAPRARPATSGRGQRASRPVPNRPPLRVARAIKPPPRRPLVSPKPPGSPPAPPPDPLLNTSTTRDVFHGLLVDLPAGPISTPTPHYTILQESTVPAHTLHIH